MPGAGVGSVSEIQCGVYRENFVYGAGGRGAPSIGNGLRFSCNE